MIKNYIYKISNLKTNKIYIGKTNNPEYRKHKHFYLLKTNKHFNKYLQNSFNSHGQDAFTFEVIYELKEGENWEEVERGYIKSNNSLVPGGYNISIGGKGGSWSDTERAYNSKVSNQQRVENVLQINRATLEVVNIFPSKREAERQTGIRASSISRVCRRLDRHAGNYYWVEEKDYDNWKPKIDARSKPVALFYEGEFIIALGSLRQAETLLGINRQVLSERIINKERLKKGEEFTGEFITQEQYYQM